MVSFARATRGLRRPSLDTRSGRPIWPTLKGADGRAVVARCAQSRATLTVPFSRCLEQRKEGMEPDGLLCSCNARSRKVRCKDVRSFFCSRSARPPKGLARRPQSKAPHALAWLSIELEEKFRMDTRSGRPI
jgi:hypothetical protein